jgi:hypothetical protein
MNLKMIREANLRALADSIGGSRALAIYLNKSHSQIIHLIGKRPIKKIGDQLAAQIEFAFHKPPGWLDNFHYDINQCPIIYPSEEGSFILCRPIPLFDELETRELSPVPSKKSLSFIANTALTSAQSFALRIHGNSMEAKKGISFPHHSLVIVEPKANIEFGDFVAMTFPNAKEPLLRQWVTEGDKIYLKPLNTHYPIIEYTEAFFVHGLIKKCIVDC